MTSILTVTYEPEVPLLQLQAISIKKFLNPDGISKIIIVINELEADPLALRLQEDVIPLYGEFAEKVVIWHAGQVISEYSRASGWKRQQTIKLMAGRLIDTRAYITLDSKNHFIAPSSISDFIGDDGRYLTTSVKPGGRREFRRKLMCQYFETSADLDRLMPITTPFVLDTAIVRGMLNSIESREETSFSSWFHAAGPNFTEFYLYYAWLCATHQLDLYSFGTRISHIIWEGSPTVRALDDFLDDLPSRTSRLLALHRKRASILSAEEIQSIAAFWTRVGLTACLEEGKSFLERFQKE